MIELVLKSSDAQQLLRELFRDENESCAVLFTREVRRRSRVRLLVGAVVIPAPSDYTTRTPQSAELRPTFVAYIAGEAARRNCTVVFCHSHTGEQKARFSEIDDSGEKHLSAFLHRRGLNGIHCAMVVSSSGSTARVLGTSTPIRVVEVGENLRTWTEADSPVPVSFPELVDRQLRAFGIEGQRSLERLRICVVGLGGTGSVVAQELAHLGVRRLLLVDPDTIESTNLNRVANASNKDLGQFKTRVAARYIRRVRPDARISELRGDVVHASIAARLTEVDLIFGCTDSHGSRSVIQQIAYQYLIPCIDMGAVIVANLGTISHVFGRIQLLGPGMPCLHCCGLLDSHEVRRDLMTAFERKTDPYFLGPAQPAPSVMSLNATVASLAVTMLLSMVAGVPSKGRDLLYNAMTSTLRPVAHAADPHCFVCSDEGVLALGDSTGLMARQD